MVQQAVHTFSFSKYHCHTEGDQSMVLHVTWEDIRILMSHLWVGNGFGVGHSWHLPCCLAQYLSFFFWLQNISFSFATFLPWLICLLHGWNGPVTAANWLKHTFVLDNHWRRIMNVTPKGRDWQGHWEREGVSSPKTVRSVSLELYTDLERVWLKTKPTNRKTDLGDDRKTERKGERLQQRQRHRERTSFQPRQ